MLRDLLNQLLRAAIDDTTPSPARLQFMIRCYPEVGSPALHAALEGALSPALAAFEAERDAARRCRWLGALADATVMVLDDTLQALIDARLPAVVDGLEAEMRRGYEPGEGVIGQPAERQIELALALLTAFDLTARLPYGMLAEELLQRLNRHARAEAGRYGIDLVSHCRAAQAFARLAALHRDAEYMARAVVAPQANYQAQAAAILQALHGQIPHEAEAAAEYGLAHLDAFALTALPN